MNAQSNGGISTKHSVDEIRAFIVKAFRECATGAEPYSHWLLDDVLPEETGHAVAQLPFQAPDIGDTEGKRETHNAFRIFFSEENQERHPVCKKVAEAFQHPETVAVIEEVTGAKLKGASLRIEFAQDRHGFWLEPHTDIGPKRITFMNYLSDFDGAEKLGTDIFDNDHKRVGSAPAAFNQGFIFIPADDTWHGFVERPVGGVRCSLIINWVGPEWRNRQELAFPDQPSV